MKQEGFQKKSGGCVDLYYSIGTLVSRDSTGELQHRANKAEMMRVQSYMIAGSCDCLCGHCQTQEALS